MNILGIGKDVFPRVYPLLEWHFQSFADRSKGEIKAEDLIDRVMAERAQCWIAWDGEVKACALTEVNDGHIKAVELHFCAGKDRSEWQKPLMDEIKSWAHHIGATRLRTINRPGHTRFLREWGMRETHRVMECEIEDSSDGHK